MDNKWDKIGTIFWICVLLVSTIVFGFLCIYYINELNATSNLLEYVQNELTLTTEQLQVESNRVNNLEVELEYAGKTISDLKSEDFELVYMGDFKLTHYCVEPDKHICGEGTGLTATGTQVTADLTVAVDPSVIPYGSLIYIEGYGWRIAEDCGGVVKNKHIDIAVDTHDKALSMGVKNGGVWILVE